MEVDLCRVNYRTTEHLTFHKIRNSHCRSAGWFCYWVYLDLEENLLSTDPTNIIIILIATLFSLGVLTFIAGIVILAISASDGGIRTIAEQATNLAKKGIAENVAGLVGNAANLLNGVNQLTRTRTGIGVFLAILGLIMMIGASLIAIKVRDYLI